MNTKIMKVKDIRPAEYNPRVTLKPGDAEYEALKNSLERFGVAEPLIVNKTTGNLVSGHQRLNVLKASGAEEVEVVIVEMDGEQEKLLNIAMNKIDGDWDYQKLEELFGEIEAADIKFTGFTPDELKNLFDMSEDAWEDTEDDIEEIGAESKEEKAPADKEFNIFLSFPTKERAEEWLKNRDIEIEYEGTARNITIRMEGLDYGTGN